MSDRSLALLLTLGFFMLVAAWIPFLDAIVRLSRRRRQKAIHTRFRREVEQDLPRLDDFRPKVSGRPARPQLVRND